ncbi:MAG: cupredoxin domain-containing protein [Gammaproteobacteria bacterium]|nr:cupredoxin domain-containing protein [Gammaproteobacteria bacterium]
MKSKLAVLFAGFALSLSVSAADAPATEFTIVIKNHRFEPAEVTVPAGKKVKLVVDNQDATPEEFESHDLKREKVIAGNTKATIAIGPLKAGSYDFVGEYNEDTAKGKIVAQ